MPSLNSFYSHFAQRYTENVLATEALALAAIARAYKRVDVNDLQATYPYTIEQVANVTAAAKYRSVWAAWVYLSAIAAGSGVWIGLDAQRFRAGDPLTFEQTGEGVTPGLDIGEKLAVVAVAVSGASLFALNRRAIPGTLAQIKNGVDPVDAVATSASRSQALMTTEVHHAGRNVLLDAVVDTDWPKIPEPSTFYDDPVEVDVPDWVDREKPSRSPKFTDAELDEFERSTTLLSEVDPESYPDHVFKAYRRKAQPGACSFCVMLASRGAVYATASSAVARKDGSRYHDRCRCTAELEVDEDRVGEYTISQSDIREIARRSTASVSAGGDGSVPVSTSAGLDWDMSVLTQPEWVELNRAYPLVTEVDMELWPLL